MTDFDMTKWQGRNDVEEGTLAQRWHHRVTPPSADKTSNPAQSLGMIGFCCDVGVERNHGRLGAANGPDVFRQQMKNIPCHGTDQNLIDFGDVHVEGQNLELGQNELAQKVAFALPRVKRLLVVGGGHETAFGSFQGLRQHLGEDSKIGIINLDAHLDIRCPGAAGPSSGTPFFQIQGLTGPNNFHYYCLGVAMESNTQSLFQRAKDWGVKFLMDKEINEAEPMQIKSELEAFAKPLDALYLTIDMDVLPHYQAPGVSAPAVRGVNLNAIEMIVDQVIEIAQHCKFGLPLVEIVELNPRFDVQGVSARTASVLADRMLKLPKCNAGSS